MAGFGHGNRSEATHRRPSANPSLALNRFPLPRTVTSLGTKSGTESGISSLRQAHAIPGSTANRVARRTEKPIARRTVRIHQRVNSAHPAGSERQSVTFSTALVPLLYFLLFAAHIIVTTSAAACPRGLRPRLPSWEVPEADRYETAVRSSPGRRPH
jgi:hypothetical protein